MKKESDNRNNEANNPRLNSYTKDSIREFFKSIGIPLVNGTGEKEETTSIFLLNKPSEKPSNDKYNK